MKHLFLASVSALSLAIAGCATHADENMATSHSHATSLSSETVQHSSATSMAAGKVRRTVVLVTNDPTNEFEYRSSLAGPGLLALVSSQLAQSKATNPNVKTFADAEVAEQLNVSQSLKDMNTTIPLLNADQQLIMGKLKSAKKGQEFDEAYMEAQITNHKKLLEITENYLDNANKSSDLALEKSSQNLAATSLALIKRHLKTATNLEDTID